MIIYSVNVDYSSKMVNEEIREVINQLRVQVNRMQDENNKLGSQVDQLQEESNSLNEMQKQLSEICDSQGQTVNQFSSLVKENSDLIQNIKVSFDIYIKRSTSYGQPFHFLSCKYYFIPCPSNSTMNKMI